MSDILKRLTAKNKVRILENQLLTGYKTVPRPDNAIGTAPLTDEDRKEIRKQIDKLKQK